MYKGNEGHSTWNRIQGRATAGAFVRDCGGELSAAAIEKRKGGRRLADRRQTAAGERLQPLGPPPPPPPRVRRARPGVVRRPGPSNNRLGGGLHQVAPFGRSLRP